MGFGDFVQAMAYQDRLESQKQDLANQLLQAQIEEHKQNKLKAAQLLEQQQAAEIAGRNALQQYINVPREQMQANPNRLPYDMTPEFNTALNQFLATNSGGGAVDAPIEANFLSGTRPLDNSQMRATDYSGPTAGQPVQTMQPRPQQDVWKDQLNTLIQAELAGAKLPANISKLHEQMKPEMPVTWQDLGNGLKYTVVDRKPVFAPQEKTQETWSAPETMKVGGKTAVVQKSSTGQIKPVVQDTPKISVGMGVGEKADMYEKRAAFGELPALRKDAEAAKNALPRLDRMLQILDSGNAGSTASYLQRILAPYAPEAKSANEAQLFQIYARLVSGPQRVNIIGPGTQTEKEGELLVLVGGGGNNGRAALRELLTMHRNGYMNKIEEYNGMITSAGTKIYKPIVLGGGNTPSTPSGKSGKKPLSAY